MSKLWNRVSSEHVLKAIELFDKEKPSFSPSKNTFLLINNIEYPAKFIRGMAYKIATGKEISTDDYSGGEQTVKFLNNLGFVVKYQGHLFDPHSKDSSNSDKKKVQRRIKVSKHEIARLIVKKKQIDRNGKTINVELVKLVKAFVSEYKGNKHFEFIVTPGGFLNFEFPKHFQSGYSVESLEDQISQFECAAKAILDQFFNSLGVKVNEELSKIGDFISIGIDGSDSNNHRHMELVAIYSLKKRKVVSWTGKFYPTEHQKRNLVKVNDLNSHFIVLNGQRVAVLGCHDLNVFSPRGQAMVTEDSYKGRVSNKFQSLFKKFKPEIVLQHPHNTDSPRIWRMPWDKINKDYRTVMNYASGIKYFNRRGPLRAELERVLSSTKKGDVVDFHN